MKKKIKQSTSVEDYKAMQKAVPSLPFKKKIKSMEEVKSKNIEDIFSKNNRNESSRIKRKGKKSRY